MSPVTKNVKELLDFNLDFSAFGIGFMGTLGAMKEETGLKRSVVSKTRLKVDHGGGVYVSRC